MERIDKLRSFLAASPRDPFLNHALALELMKLGDDTGARQVLEQLLTHDPSYIGSYYHLARLLERQGERQLAIDWYQKGMTAARAARDMHAYNELQAAFEDLE
ncbi:MAG: hypothetical protein P0Y53_14025 [Candidatus Pseudobacter hemicellulosilyticus]|uniref:Tetratricopeptide repeat protein n=1 Tax=Candidatus Pseudobacter hemicellulosilyticus TaxID=3121375 RepID=A0AAJ6BDG5_9BACT|nr:MAG: hypothetical protein P0Y53_14025 [Pseudobacter sp.]